MFFRFCTIFDCRLYVRANVHNKHKCCVYKMAQKWPKQCARQYSLLNNTETNGICVWYDDENSKFSWNSTMTKKEITKLHTPSEREKKMNLTQCQPFVLYSTTLLFTFHIDVVVRDEHTRFDSSNVMSICLGNHLSPSHTFMQTGEWGVETDTDTTIHTPMTVGFWVCVCVRACDEFFEKARAIQRTSENECAHHNENGAVICFSLPQIPCNFIRFLWNLSNFHLQTAAVTTLARHFQSLTQMHSKCIHQITMNYE